MGIGGIESEQVQLYDIETDKNLYRLPYDIGSDFKISVLYDNDGTNDRYMPINRLVGKFRFHIEKDATPDKDYTETGITDNSSIIDSLKSKRWSWEQKPAGIGLYEWNDSSGYYTAPTIDINDGLKISYLGIVCFIDGSDAVVTTPDETSYINVPDTYVPAVIMFMKSLATEDPTEREYWERKFTTEHTRVTREIGGTVQKVMPINMYSVKKTR